MNRDIFSLAGKLVIIASDMEPLAAEIAVGLTAFGARAMLILPDCFDCSGNASEGGDVGRLYADFGDDKSVSEAAEEAIKRLGGIDVLVTRFGIERSRALIDVSTADLHGEFQAVWSGLRVAQLCRSAMAVRGGGVIVNLHPISASWPAAGDAPRAMASAAGLALSQSLALEGAVDGIHSVTISLGGRFGDDGGLTKRNLLGRQAHIDEVIGAIVAVASKAGGFLTATNLVVDGGELAI